jgi:hypothetical protein
MVVIGKGADAKINARQVKTLSRAQFAANRAQALDVVTGYPNSR